MTALARNKINSLVRILKNKSSVEFKHDELYYQVFESSEGGYAINVYSSDARDEDGELIYSNMIDGGLCSGSARDAVTFML
ncbi:hypothetical protein KJ877_08920 [bacterium]|nr:hypothetical protein [bacterium]MBU1990819.1 hypothetical protein [bacterium]